MTEILSLKFQFHSPSSCKMQLTLLMVGSFHEATFFSPGHSNTHSGVRHLEEQKDLSRQGEGGDQPLERWSGRDEIKLPSVTSPTPQTTCDKALLCFLIPTFSLLTIRLLLAIKTSHDSKLEKDYQKMNTFSTK